MVHDVLSMACTHEVNVDIRSGVPNTQFQTRSGSLDPAYLMVGSSVGFHDGDACRDSRELNVRIPYLRLKENKSKTRYARNSAGNEGARIVDGIC